MSGARSFLDEVRAKREQARTANHELDRDLPGTAGRVVVRYKPVAYAVLEAMAVEVSEKGAKGRTLALYQDTLLSACKGIYLRDDDGKLIPADPESPEPPLFDRFAELLGAEPVSARDAIAECFPNEFALIEEANVVTQWTRRIGREEDDKLLGESADTAS